MENESSLKENIVRELLGKNIIQSFKECRTNDEALLLLRLISRSAIKEYHDEIISAIRNYFNFASARKWKKEIDETILGLEKQKIEMEKKEKIFCFF